MTLRITIPAQAIDELEADTVADHRHSFGDTALLEALLREAGFHDVRLKTISRSIRFNDDAPFLRVSRSDDITKEVRLMALSYHLFVGYYEEPNSSSRL